MDREADVDVETHAKSIGATALAALPQAGLRLENPFYEGVLRVQTVAEKLTTRLKLHFLQSA